LCQASPHERSGHRHRHGCHVARLNQPVVARSAKHAHRAGAAGLGLRLLADYALTRTGGSLTGVQEGEPLYAIRRRSLPVPPGGGDGEAEV
jgi:hypothetical protein